MKLPSGTVTFLFTDIESSTQLWEAHPVTMRQVLARHDHLLHTAVIEHGGYIVKTTGDGLHAVFTTAPNGVAAALAGQRALQSEKWPRDVGALRVRMALHSGTAEQRDGDYYGSAVNRAARLLDLGHGGQTLLSAATQALVRDSLPSEVTLTYLGEHALKDLLQLEQVYQLTAPDLPRDFPPLATPTAPPVHLPTPTTPFFGRKRELAEAVNLLHRDEVQLLTLTGPGGVGKTRLALEIARSLAGAYRDGVFFIDLAPLNALHLLAPTIMEVLGLRESADHSPAEMIRRYLEQRQVLLVLDNCEHLLTAEDNGYTAPELVAAVMAAAPEVKLLITSREALNLQGEWLYPLHGLSVPRGQSDAALANSEAVQLFVASARRVRPGFSLAEEAAGVARICKLVEGVPLALELAASWTRTLGCDAIADEIAQNLAFLGSSRHNVPQRHRSMRAVFDYSWALLEEPECAIFKRLAVFRGSFTREAAAEVAGASLFTLSVLVDKSLLRWENGRYYIHQLLRQYAVERLEQTPEEMKRARDAHCTHYTNLLKELMPLIRGPGQREALERIETELENVRAAWRWAVEQRNIAVLHEIIFIVSNYFQFRSRYVEGSVLLQKADRCLREVRDGTLWASTRVTLLAELSWMYLRLGCLIEARNAALEAEALFTQHNLRPTPGIATDPLLVQGVLALTQGDYAAAEGLGEEALARNEQYGHRSNTAVAHYLLARAALLQGDADTAQAHAEQSYALTQALGDCWFLAYCHNELGNVASLRGDYNAAKAHYEESYTIRQAFDDAEGMALALTYLGQVALEQEDYAQAHEHYTQAVEIYERIYDKGGLAGALCGLGNTAVATGDYTNAWDNFQKALQIAADMQYTPVLLSLLVSIGKLLILTQRTTRGIELLALAHHHPGSEHDVKARAEQLLKDYRITLTPASYEAAVTRGRQQDLAHMVRTVEAMLPTLVMEPQTAVGPNGSVTAEQPLVEPLTPREMEVLACIADGLTNQEIADRLVLALGTVKSYTSEIYGKLNVSNRTEAVARARALQLLA